VHQPISPPAGFRIPPLIKRNTALFAISQSVTGAGMQLAYGIGPLMVIEVTHSASLAGLSVALLGLSRFMVAYPVGKVTDTYGRKPGIQLGLALALVGAILTGLSMIWHSAAALIAGMLVFSMGMSAAQQLRVAATDMFPPHLRAQALGYVALGSLIGLVIAPVMLALSDRFAAGLGYDPLGLPWFMLPALIVSGMIIVTFVRPDPKEIGMRLEDYYPNYTRPARRAGGTQMAFRAVDLLRDPETRLAIASNCAGQGNMSIVMVLTSLVLAHHGHTLTAIAFSHMFHSMGMFAFTIPLGRMADRYGRGIVMYPGVATTIVGAGLVTFASGLLPVTLGTFLVGVGWAAANVAATALIADHAETHERGRAIGVADSFAGAVSVATAVVVGPLIAWSSLAAAGWTAVLVAAIPLLMLAWNRVSRAPS
jgi:MFS family permease